MRRGRPIGSSVRQNILEILAVLGRGHGYQIYKVYRDVYPKVTLRVIYYHLKKGLDLGELEIQNVEREKGDYSWGSEEEKIYYKLGPKAEVQGDERLKTYLASKQQT